MTNEIIIKKLEQIKQLLGELDQVLSLPWQEFSANWQTVRSAERNFQLIVDLASDINTQLLLEAGQPTPDTYRQSFLDMGRLGRIPNHLADQLAMSAGLRNVLVHEYDLEEDPQRFYEVAKNFSDVYKEYCRLIQQSVL